MAITHLQRFAAYLDLHRSAITLACVYLRHGLYLESGSHEAKSCSRRPAGDAHASRREAATVSWIRGFQINNPRLAKCFDAGDDAAHDAAYHAADRIPAAHPQTAERASGDTKQNVTDRML